MAFPIFSNQNYAGGIPVIYLIVLIRHQTKMPVIKFLCGDCVNESGNLIKRYRLLCIG